jgi:hypothetical protein
MFRQMGREPNHRILIMAVLLIVGRLCPLFCHVGSSFEFQVPGASNTVKAMLLWAHGGGRFNHVQAPADYGLNSAFQVRQQSTH